MKTNCSYESYGRGSKETWARERNRWWRNCLLGTMYARSRWFDGQHHNPNKLADVGRFFFAAGGVVGRARVHRSFLNGRVHGSQTRAGVCDGSKNERESYNRCGDDGKFVEHVLVCRLTVQKRLSIIHMRTGFSDYHAGMIATRVDHSLIRRNRSAFAITETELNVMAALAMIGLNRSPKNGYKTPAAMGTPITL